MITVLIVGNNIADNERIAGSIISKGSPIAAGAAGNMDTMLVPVTKFVGIELGLVTLITGAILTFLVPLILPFFYGVFS
ncbi:MAG TPA: LysO family transporter [Anaerovoracaceae bacterium]|nr:LysO family transporter [Anaerovoracaceae bacterium]